MKKLLIFIILFSSLASFGQDKWHHSKMRQRWDSIGIGPTKVITPAKITAWDNATAGTSTIAGATDANISSPTNLQLLQYQTIDNKWHNATIDFSRLAIAPCNYATAAALAANTYANGTSGVGATITFNATGTQSLDGTDIKLDSIYLIKDEATASHNGVYKCTTAPAVGVAGVLTRVTYYDQSAEILTGTTTFILPGNPGATNANKTFTMNSPGTITVGTTDITWTQTGGASGGGGMADPGANGILVRTALNVTANRTLTGTTNRITITNGDGVAGNPTFDYGTNIIDKTQINTYNVGAKQIFQADATSADIRLTGFNADPSTLSDGDIWYRYDVDIMKYRANGITRSIANLDETQTLTNKTINLSNNTLTTTLSQLSGAVSDDDVAGVTTAQTLTNKSITPRVNSNASSATPTPVASTDDMYILTALAANATFAAPGAGVDGQTLLIRIKDNGTARTLAFNSGTNGYRASSDLPLPTTTIISKTMYLKFIFNSTDSKWDFVSMIDNFNLLSGFMFSIILGGLATGLERRIRRRRIAA